MDNDFYSDIEIGNIIKQHRNEKGMTQLELAKMLGVSKAAIGKWETGVVRNIKRDVLQQIAEILDVNPLTLVGFKDIEPAPKVITVKAEDFTPERFIQIENFIKFIQIEEENERKSKQR